MMLMDKVIYDIESKSNEFDSKSLKRLIKQVLKNESFNRRDIKINHIKFFKTNLMISKKSDANERANEKSD